VDTKAETEIEIATTTAADDVKTITAPRNDTTIMTGTMTQDNAEGIDHPSFDHVYMRGDCTASGFVGWVSDFQCLKRQQQDLRRPCNISPITPW